jgi:multisubunit Na+/H+ antiporter MnhB subunit
MVLGAMLGTQLRKEIMRTLTKFVFLFTLVLCLAAFGQTATAPGVGTTSATVAAATAAATTTTTNSDAASGGSAAASDNTERYFLMGTGGWGPATGGRGEGSAGVRIGTGIYSLTSMNLAGGVGAVTEDILYRAASVRGVTLWARAGAGLTTTNTPTSTSTAPTFGGGAMVSYDLSRIRAALAGVEVVASCKIMYATTTVGSAATSTVKPMYQLGVKYSWQ